MKRVIRVAGAAALAAGLGLAAASASAEVIKSEENGVTVWRPAYVEPTPAPQPVTVTETATVSEPVVVIDAAKLFALNADREAYHRLVLPGYPFDNWYWRDRRYPF